MIRRDINFNEDLLCCIPTFEFMTSSSYKPSSMDVPYSYISPPFGTTPILISFLDYYNEDGNPPLPTHPSPTPASPLPKWVCLAWEVASNIFNVHLYQLHKHSYFQEASSLLAQISNNYDPNTFEELYSHLDWHASMNKECYT